ncbi:hypothetical protein V6N13_105845 [Hibiscus sabdariffa]
MGLRHGVADCKVFCLRTVGAGQDPKISNLYLLIGGASLEKLQLMVHLMEHSTWMPYFVFTVTVPNLTEDSMF